MKEVAIDTLKKYFGAKAVSGIILIGLGALCWWWVSEHFISKATFAAEKERFVEQIQIGDSTQKLQIMYLRLDLVKKSIEEAEDKLEDKPQSQKWKNRLTERVHTRRTIEKKIDEINKGLNVKHKED